MDRQAEGSKEKKYEGIHTLYKKDNIYMLLIQQTRGT